MKKLLAAAALLSAMGCRSSSEIFCQDPNQQCVCATCAAACPAPCPTPQKQEKPSPPAKSQQPTPRETVTTREESAAIAQDIMLVPRTVYVPYAPQTPVRPVRLGSLAPGALQTVIRESTRTQRAPESAPRSESPSAGMSKDDSKEILNALRCLHERLDNIEARTQSLSCPPPPVDCPPPPPRGIRHRILK